MFSNRDNSKVPCAYSSLRSVVVWLALAAGVATVSAVSVVFTANIADNQQQNIATEDVGAKANGDLMSVDSGVLGEPYHFDHAVVNEQNLPEEPNPSPLAVAAYN
jgi:hypothetical protein